MFMKRKRSEFQRYEFPIEISAVNLNAPFRIIAKFQTLSEIIAVEWCYSGEVLIL